MRILLLVTVGVLASGSGRAALPWADAGLTERQAAAHLVDRFTFGATPGQVDDVVMVGVDPWFREQLAAADGPPAAVREALAGLDTIRLTNEEILRICPPAGRVRRQLQDDGTLDPAADEETQRAIVREYYADRGLLHERELTGQLLAAKVYRAVISPRQVEEVLVDFWFNHFYVAATDNQARRFLGPYERDAIRANVFGTFRTMLAASAKHPAMLLYLDNAQSVAEPNARTTAGFGKEEIRDLGGPNGTYEAMLDRMDRRDARRREQMAKRGNRAGLNENYARELLELHTLGVDGGYDQHDVEGVARALTGWTVLPEGERRERIRERMQDDVMPRLGYVLDGDFFFDAGGHDAGPKTILGRELPWGGGLEEGEDVLATLARHRSTARHLARKLCVRFVRDDPPDEIVAAVAKVFRVTDGDLTAVVRAIVENPAFWAQESRRAKIKSPLELAASSVRALGGDVHDPRRLVRWIDRMGQPLYRYSAPTGFPDDARTWVNAGALLHRMNFGLSLAAGKVRGVEVDPGVLTDGREPESAEAALREYAQRLLPERELDPTIAALRPMLGRPDVAATIENRADALAPDDPAPPDQSPATKGGQARREAARTQAHVVGLILGSPEFQRR